MAVKKRRIESPTSILTYMQCPRKYYYRYVKGLKGKPSIHLIAGSVAHSTIQAFHNTDVTLLEPEGFFEKLQSKIMEEFNKKWREKKEEIEKLRLSQEEKHLHYDKTRMMIRNFFYYHTNRIIAHKYCHNLSLVEAWQKVKPKTETKLSSEKYGVRAVIDAVHDIDNETIIIDYKTSKKSEIDTDCMLQLAICCLLYKERYGGMPSKAGIHFLRHGEKIIPASYQLLTLAKRTCWKIHQVTKEESIAKYPKKISGLCKYKTGQCDYYEKCVGKEGHL
jgi:CRISPR/Cas system-associated exonuclease Cas4 (RecB family)